jgi:hypothetical protein
MNAPATAVGRLEPPADAACRPRTRHDPKLAVAAFDYGPYRRQN